MTMTILFALALLNAGPRQAAVAGETAIGGEEVGASPSIPMGSDGAVFLQEREDFGYTDLSKVKPNTTPLPPSTPERTTVDPLTPPPDRRQEVSRDPARVAQTEQVLARAEQLRESGDGPAAAALVEKALAADPGNPRLKAFVEAEKRRVSVVETMKDRARRLLSGMLDDVGEELPQGAGPAVSTQALRASARIPDSWTALGTGGQGVRVAQGPLQQAAAKFKIGDYAAAERLLTQRLQEVPGDPHALRYRALTRRMLRRYEPSAEDALQVLKLTPRDPLVRGVLIEDLVDLGRPREALGIAEAALKAGPHDAAVLVGRARAWQGLGRHDRALADLKEAAELDAQFETAYRTALSAAGRVPDPGRPRSRAVWFGAAGAALLLIGYAFFRRRSDSSVRRAFRAEFAELPAQEARPDRVPNGFQVLRVLGQGGMGVVYEAMDLALQRPVALKKLRPEVADNPRERSRFLKEARTVAALKHPNIVEIHAIHEDEGGLFLVFEKVPGETLHERLGRGLLRPADAIAVLRQVALALDYAHGQGVVHQDLKPGNIMFSGDRAKVMDFGIARRVAETMSTLSKLEIAGTPAYMAPEQEQGVSVGPPADIFALGVCAYETLSGRTPFPSGNGILKAQKAFTPLSKAVPGLPAGADDVLGRALEPEPGARWPSASSFVEALARVLA